MSFIMNIDLLNHPISINFITGWVVKSLRGDYCPMHKHVNWELVYHQQGSGKTSLQDGSEFKYEHSAWCSTARK